METPADQGTLTPSVWPSFVHFCWSEEDLREVAATLIRKAKEGDMVAARELLDRLIGRTPSATDPSVLALEKKRLRLQEKQLDIARDRA